MMINIRKTLLIVDDAPEVHELISHYIGGMFSITHTFTFDEAEDACARQKFNFIIIDIELNGASGLELFEVLKGQNPDSRYFIITGHLDEEFAIKSHQLGIDEFIHKPISKNLFQAILFKHLKKEVAILNFGPLEINLERQEVYLHSEDDLPEKLNLCKKEMELLIKFAKNPDRIFSREDLHFQVWGTDSNSTLRTVDMHISNLRKKLKHFGHAIETVRLFGYRLNS